MKTTTYIGDGVYATKNSYGIVLTTGHHEESQADNVILLENSVMDSFSKWANNGWRDYNSGKEYK